MCKFVSVSKSDVFLGATINLDLVTQFWWETRQGYGLDGHGVRCYIDIRVLVVEFAVWDANNDRVHRRELDEIQGREFLQAIKESNGIR